MWRGLTEAVTSVKSLTQVASAQRLTVLLEPTRRRS